MKSHYEYATPTFVTKTVPQYNIKMASYSDLNDKLSNIFLSGFHVGTN